MAEVVIDDMAIGNPVSPVAQLALLGLVPGIHIAQFPFQVIGNCGVISLMQRSNRQGLSGTIGSGGPGLYAGTTPAIAGWRDAQYDGIVAFAACEYFERGPGVILMMVVMLVAGIGCLLAGLLAIGFGIPVKEFSFGNTLILTGAVAACTGLIMLGLWAVVRELKNIAQRLGPGAPRLDADTAADSRSGAAAPSGAGKRRLPVQPRPSRGGRCSRSRTSRAAIGGRRGARRPRRAIAPADDAAARRNLPRPRPPSNRGAICCFPPHRGGNASARKHERPMSSATDLRVPRQPPCRRRSKSSEAAAGDIRRRLAKIGTLEVR